MQTSAQYQTNAYWHNVKKIVFIIFYLTINQQTKSYGLDLVPSEFLTKKNDFYIFLECFNLMDPLQ